MAIYDRIILWCWAAFLLVWAVSALFVKRDVPRAGDAAAWQRPLLLRLAATVLILTLVAWIARSGPSIGAAFFPGIFPPPPALGWAAATLTGVGVAFAMWARIYLGRNWSSRPAVKEQHELVTSGPYALVRHPIYSGIILATLGTALTGALLGVVLLIAFMIAFTLRIGKEEQLMLERFPSQYPEYQRRTRRLLPYLW